MFPSKGKEAKQNWFLRMNPRRVETQQKRSWKEQGRGRNKRNKAPLGRTVCLIWFCETTWELWNGGRLQWDADVWSRCIRYLSRVLSSSRRIFASRVLVFAPIALWAQYRSRTSSHASHFHPVSTIEHQPHFRRHNSIRPRCAHYWPISDSN